MSGKKLLHRIREEIRRRNYSYSTEKAYSNWVVRYVRFHKMTHPSELQGIHVVQFLNHLANQRHVSSSTQNQALSALVFLYEHILNAPVGDLKNLQRAKKYSHLPVVLSREEVTSILETMTGVEQLIAELIYGSGMRISEALHLRVQDIDFHYHQITIRNGKGSKDRMTMLPEKVVPKLKKHLQKVRRLHDNDLNKGFGKTILPGALAVKYPGAESQFMWQYVFPASTRRRDPFTGIRHRYHVSSKNVRVALRNTVRQLNIQKKVSPHTFRHSFATHLLQCGYDIRTVQDLLGHKSLNTTSIYLHVLNRGGHGVKSPLDM
ncbi:integron integrase [Pleurocapsales cyanobacterium LEGE 10410]|nr:integron integrase [Pleurocapsales cyanobacterium LEGE 10410]